MTEPQNQKGAELGAEDKTSQEMRLSYCSALRIPGTDCRQHCPPSDARLHPCQKTKGHQASSQATMLVAAIMDPIVSWEKPHKEWEGVCVCLRR